MEERKWKRKRIEEKRKKRVFLRFSFKKMREKVVYESSVINEQNKSDEKILPNTNFCRNVLGICRYKVVCVGILRFPTVVEDFMELLQIFDFDFEFSKGG